MTRRPRSSPVSLAELETKALSHLDRFDCSVAQLRKVLTRHAQRTMGQGTVRLPNETADLIDQLVERYADSGLVSDARYAESLSRTLRDRGLGRQSIIERLRARGISARQAARALEAVDADGQADAELCAAEALVRRRRLGPWRSEEQRAPHRRRDLAALARAGFSLDVALRALRIPGNEGEF